MNARRKSYLVLGFTQFICRTALLRDSSFIVLDRSLRLTVQRNLRYYGLSSRGIAGWKPAPRLINGSSSMETRPTGAREVAALPR